jgi:hypothetical protein
MNTDACRHHRLRFGHLNRTKQRRNRDRIQVGEEGAGKEVLNLHVFNISVHRDEIRLDKTMKLGQAKWRLPGSERLERKTSDCGTMRTKDCSHRIGRVTITQVTEAPNSEPSHSNRHDHFGKQKSLV